MASAPSESWFWLDGERPIGPLSTEQLRAAVSAGKVSPETLVHNAAWSHWCQAAQVPGLFSIRVARPPERPVPAPPLEAKPRREPSVAPPPPQPGPPEDFSVASLWADGPDNSPRAKGKRKRRRGPPVSVFVGLLVALVVGAGLLAVQLNVVPFWTPSQEEPGAEARSSVPAKRAVARDAKKSEADRAKGQAKEGEKVDTDFPVADFDLSPVTDRVIFEAPGPPTPQGRIDESVFAKWKELGIEPAHPCSDAVFLRRVYLDVIGTLPTSQEARAFLEDKSPEKRKKLIDALLERPEFADYWAMKWSDLLRVKAEFPINLWPNAAQAYHRWIRNSIRDNLPFDKFARELLTSSGSNFRVPQVNFYRALQSKDPRGIARAVALTFMGCRAEKWPEERLEGLSGFFFKVGYKGTGEWKEEIVFFDPHKIVAPPPAPKPDPKPAAKKTGEKKAAGKKSGEKKAAGKEAKPAPPPAPVFPDGTPAQVAPDQDPRKVFADWLITPKNPWFTRAIVNRVWCWLVGRGIVHEPDDVRPDNPASNPDLLNHLAEELVRANYDLKHVYRLILNSSTYQLSSIPKSKHPEAAVHFASYAVRRLEAEVIIDALNQITGTSESYSSIIPEPYTFIPETRRAIALPDGSITSSFLELFGRPPRDSGLEAERNNRITAGQRLHLLNSSHIRNKLRQGPGVRQILAEGNGSEDLYLAILSRFPGDREWASGEDVAWTLINSTEFLFRH